MLPAASVLDAAKHTSDDIDRLWIPCQGEQKHRFATLSFSVIGLLLLAKPNKNRHIQKGTAHIFITIFGSIF
jgi:hypothetical protein